MRNARLYFRNRKPINSLFICAFAARKLAAIVRLKCRRRGAARRPSL